MAYPANHSSFPTSSFGPAFPHATPFGAPGMPVGPGGHGVGMLPGFVVGHDKFLPQGMPHLLPLNERYGFAQPGLASLAHAMNFHGDWGAPAGLPPPLLTTVPAAGNAPALHTQALGFLSALHQQQTSDITVLRDSHLGRPNDLISHLSPDGTPTEFRSGNTYGVAWLESRGHQRHLCFDLQAANGFSATHSVRLHEADVAGTPASLMARLAHTRRSLFQHACSNQPAGLAMAGTGGFGASLMGLGLMRELMRSHQTRGMVFSHPGFAESPGAQRQLHDFLDRPAMSHRMTNFMGAGQPFGARLDDRQRQTQEACLDALHARQRRFASARMGQGGPVTPGASRFSPGVGGQGPVDVASGRRGGGRPPGGGGGGGGMATPTGPFAAAGSHPSSAAATLAARTGPTIVELDPSGRPMDGHPAPAASSESPRAGAASPAEAQLAQPMASNSGITGKKIPPPPPERRTPERTFPTASDPASPVARAVATPAPRPLIATPAAPPPAAATSAASLSPAGPRSANDAPLAPPMPPTHAGQTAQQPPADRPNERRSTTEHHHHTTTVKLVPRRPAPPPPPHTPPKARPGQPPQNAAAGAPAATSPPSSTVDARKASEQASALPSLPRRGQPPRRPSSSPARPGGSQDRPAIATPTPAVPSTKAPRVAAQQPPAVPVATTAAARDVEIEILDAVPLPFAEAGLDRVSRPPASARSAPAAQPLGTETSAIRSDKGVVARPAAQPSAPTLSTEEKPYPTSGDLSAKPWLPSYDDVFVIGGGKKAPVTSSIPRATVESRWAPGTAKGAMLADSLNQILKQMSEPSSLRKTLADRVLRRKPEDFKELVLTHVRPHVTEMRLAHARQATTEEKATHGEAAIRQVMQTHLAAGLSQLSPAQVDRLYERLDSNKGRMAALQAESRMMSSHSGSFAGFPSALREMAIDVMLSERHLLDGLEDWRTRGLAVNKSLKEGTIHSLTETGREPAALTRPAVPPAA